MTIRSLYNQSKSRVKILGIRSNLFIICVGIPQGCPTDPVCDFHGQDLKAWLWRGGCFVWEPQGCISAFSGWCGSVGFFKPISSVRTGGYVLQPEKSALSRLRMSPCLKRRSLSIWVSCSRVMAGWTERWIDELGALLRSVVVKRELSRKAKLSVYWSIFVPTLSYGHKSWVVTERTRLQKQVAEMEAPGQTKSSLEELFFPSGLRTPWVPSGGAGECCWEKGRPSFSPGPVASTTQPLISGWKWMEGWMDG